MGYSELPIYKGERKECCYCDRSFEKGEVISVTGDGLTFCYGNSPDIGCLQYHVLKTHETIIANPELFRTKSRKF